MLWELFFTFFMIGCVSFGGGYAMVPLIQEEVVTRHQWMSMQAFTDVIAVAGMSPGPIATNSAIFVGYHQSGVLGAIVSSLGMVLPSLLIILAIGAVFNRIQNDGLVKSAFYGLRPVITGLIIYTAIVFGINSGMASSFSWRAISLVLVFGLSLLALIRYRFHPIYVILLSGLVGVALYG